MFQGKQKPFADTDAILLALHLNAVAGGGVEEIYGQGGFAGVFLENLCQTAAEIGRKGGCAFSPLIFKIELRALGNKTAK